ncbi:hypothetical protein HMPREF3192_01227 [Atopobium deltae]|uniref:Uncharacterized protein n=1 Tax=Atopobium deltae TaxID=1393034 RepID=A0A133XQP6_9ACTN|nr:hypothetical protein HMPREF3192_01227 [Atopobium deltae]
MPFVILAEHIPWKNLIQRRGSVEIIHDFADPGWEQRAEYPSFWDWFKEAINLLIEKS